MTISLGYSGASAPSALRIAEESEGRIVAVRGDAEINWGRRYSSGLNPNITHATHKREMRERFAAAGVPSPHLYTPEEAMIALTEGDVEGGRLVGRPDQHTRGRGFWLCEGPRDVERALRGTRRKKAATHFMRFVAIETEYRVHIFQGQSIRISQKSFTEDRSDYTTIKPQGRKRHIRQAAKEAVAALGMDFGAVDILADDQSAYVLEVNAAPGLGGSMPRVWAQTFIDWKERNDAE